MVSSSARLAARSRWTAGRVEHAVRRAVLCAATVATCAVVTTWAPLASAEPTAADRETARSLMQEARDLRDKGHVQDALKRFKAADDIMHVPTTGLEVARTQASMGMLVEARDTVANIRKLPVGSPGTELEFAL